MRFPAQGLIIHAASPNVAAVFPATAAGSECDGGGFSPDHGVLNWARGSRDAGLSQLFVYSVNAAISLNSELGRNKNDFHWTFMLSPSC